MGEVSFERIEQLFHEALDEPPEDRRAFLDRQAEPDLAAKVLALLAGARPEDL